MTDLARSARAMGALTVVSRLTGFLRIAVFASVFGKTYLSNTYQSANMIPNLLFELFAAGALQAVLVPAMVGALGTGDDAGRRKVTALANEVLGLVCALLAVVVVVGIAAGPQLMAVLVGDVESASVRDAEIELGALFLWFFMPQVFFYGANIVATAVLNADHSFALPVAAPILNNVIVIAVYGWFGATHTGPLDVELTTVELWVVAGGTTAAVIAFCAIPVAAAWRRGVRVRPAMPHRSEAMRRLVRDGAWAGVFLAATQLLLLVVLQVSNREPGGPITYQFAFVIFTLPHSVLSVPIMTTSFPAMSRSAQLHDWTTYRDTVRAATGAVISLSALATAGMVAVARPAVVLVAYGEATELTTEIARATMAFAPGLAAFGLLLLFTRAYYAHADSRTPALVNVVSMAVAALLMITVVRQFGAVNLVAGLAGAWAVGHLLAAGALGWGVSRFLRRVSGDGLAVLAETARALVAAVAATAAGFGVTELMSWDDRGGALLATVAGGLTVLIVYGAIHVVSGGGSPGAALGTIGAGAGGSIAAPGVAMSPRADDVPAPASEVDTR